MLTPENCGCSALSCEIVNSTFLSLDGFAGLRKQMDDHQYFAAEIARITDRKIRDSEPLSKIEACSFAWNIVNGHKDLCLVDKGHVVDAMVDALYEQHPDSTAKVSKSTVRECVMDIEAGYVPTFR